MARIFLFFQVFVFIFLLSTSGQIFAQEKSTHSEKSVYFTIRMGEGGFTDNRSPIGKLGGGQLAIDVKLKKLPFALSYTGEYYTNSPNPTHIYEIASLEALNILYMKPLVKSRKSIVFLGGGLGRLGVPSSEENPDNLVHSLLINCEAGINVKLLGPVGLYGISKYLYAKKGIIDFNEFIVLLGLTFNFGF